MNGEQPALGGPLGNPAVSRRWREACSPQASLVAFAVVLWIATLLLFALIGFDDRSFRGVNVWVKPAKFMASVGSLAATTAWFIRLLQPERRNSPRVRAAAAVILVAGTFEVAYITFQASLGEASHYNKTDLAHVVLYGLMGVGALAMTATQVLMAREISRFGRHDIDPQLRRAVVVGLALTFLLGAGAGIPLSLLQPPPGAGLPFFGWHLDGDDLRPAHFIGMHAEQMFPVTAQVLRRWLQADGRVALCLLTVAYVGVWGVAMHAGLAHRSSSL